MEFIRTVAETFNIGSGEYSEIKDFVLFSFNRVPDSEAILIIDNKDESVYEDCAVRHMKLENLLGQIRVLHVSSANLYFIRYIGVNEINMNGQLIEKEKVYAFNTGSSIRNQQIDPIYYSDIVSWFAEDRIRSRIVFEVDKSPLPFQSRETGLHDISFTEQSGRLVGIMGASGAGKSTLLSTSSTARLTTHVRAGADKRY